MRNSVDEFIKWNRDVEVMWLAALRSVNALRSLSLETTAAHNGDLQGQCLV